MAFSMMSNSTNGCAACMGVVQSIIALVGLRKCKGSSEEALKGEVCVGCGGWGLIWGSLGAEVVRRITPRAPFPLCQ